MPAMIMAGTFATSVVLIDRQLGDVMLLALGVAALLSLLVRLVITRLQRHKALTASLDRQQARQSCSGIRGTLREVIRLP